MHHVAQTLSIQTLPFISSVESVFVVSKSVGSDHCGIGLLMSTPERTRKVPRSESENVRIARSTVQMRKQPRFSVTASEWMSAVPVSHGMNEEFSTGSQNHQPPQPSS